MSAEIEVARAGEGDPLVLDVTVREGKSGTRHRVTMSQRDHARLGGGASAEKTIEAAFRFLLAREPKESILGCFDVSVISRYFPEFEATLPDYLSR